MVSTFQTLVVALFAVIPGASYTFAYERVSGGYGVSLSDRLVRFLAASAIFQALLSGPELLLYRRFVATSRLRHGDVNWAVLELVALGYVLLPSFVGSLIGVGRSKGWRWVEAITGTAPEPRAWDFMWRRGIRAVVRLRLKSGIWLAGLYGTVKGKRSYASGYPEDGDLYLSLGLQIDPRSGELVRDADNRPKPVDGERGLLVRWAEVEYLDLQEF